MRIKFDKSQLFWLVILFPYLCLIPASIWYFKKLRDVKASTFIVINKQDYSLSQFDYKGNKLRTFPVAFGKSPGNKTEKGDNKTPEGIFSISGIENSSSWSHDFQDGKGKIEGAYGPHFIRLNVPGHKGIGIHGTHDNNSIRSRVSEGCIRMKNDDLETLVKNIKSSSIVVIIPSVEDQEINFYKPKIAEGSNSKINKIK